MNRRAEALGLRCLHQRVDYKHFNDIKAFKELKIRATETLIPGCMSPRDNDNFSPADVTGEKQFCNSLNN